MSNRPQSGERGFSGSTPPDGVAKGVPIATSPVKRMRVLWFFLLTGFTAGIYYPIWFLRRLPAFDNLAPHERLGRGLIVAALVLMIASILVFPAGRLARAIGLDIDGYDIDDSFEFLFAVAEFCMLVVCLRLRRALLIHYAQTDVEFSLLWTLLFGAFYFQFKFNRMAAPADNAA